MYVIYSNYMRNSISAFLKSLDSSKGKSLSQLQLELFKKSQRQSSTRRLLPSTQNVNDMKVVSPFYVRPQPCNNQHCFCPYHRKLRIKQIPLKKIENLRQTYAQTTGNSPNNKTKAQAKKHLKMLTQRNIIERKQNLKMKSTANLEGRHKVQSHNYEFDQFLSQFEQILLKKSKLSSLDLHRIKISVGQIFKYIYANLDKENEVVQAYISKIEKDRDFTNFYMQRFMELKERFSKKKETEPPTTLKKKTTLFNPSSELQIGTRNQTKARTKLFQGRQTAKKTMKGRYHKLIIQRMLDDIDCGEEIEEEQVQKLADLELSLFEQNCEFLTKKFKQMDQDTMEQLLEQIINKTKKTVLLREANETNSSKVANLDKIIELIKAQLKQFEQKQSQNDKKSFRSNMSSRSNNRVGSNHSIRKNNKRLTMLNKTNESGFVKSGFNQLRKEGRGSEMYNQSQGDLFDEAQLKSIDAHRQSAKAMTMFHQGEDIMVITGRAQKLKLAKYRKLSHDAFYHQKILNEEEEHVMSKMKITTFSDIDAHLDNLAFQFAAKKNRIKDIQTKIKEFNLKKFMVQENDSLITAKRKIRVLKSLINNNSQQVQPEVKQEMKEYLKLMEQQNYVKNRKWANKKIKNVMQLRAEDEDGQMDDEIIEEDENKYYFQNVMADIFGKANKMYFYELIQTVFEEKEINFQHNAPDFIKTTLIQEKRQKDVKRSKKKTFHQKMKAVANEVEDRQSALMQVGLNNKCLSNYFLLGDSNHEQRYETRHLLEQDESYRPSEDRYLSLLNKLARFSR